MYVCTHVCVQSLCTRGARLKTTPVALGKLESHSWGAEWAIGHLPSLGGQEPGEQVAKAFGGKGEQCVNGEPF